MASDLRSAPSHLDGKGRAWTEHETDLLRRFYLASGSGPVDLKRAAKLIGRCHTNVCRKAKQLGLTDRHRPKSKQLTLTPRPMTKEELARAMSSATKQRWAEKGHPRGMLGKKHKPETIATIAEKSRAMWADPSSKLNSLESQQRRSDHMVSMVESGKMRGGYTRSAGGRRADLGERYFRSSWEANYARYLNWMVRNGKILRWEYEPKTFVFEAIRRGTRAYTPDFLVVFPDSREEWHEVKGWMDQQSKTRLGRMAKYFPEEVVVVIGEAWFRAARRSVAPLIPNWETSGSRSQVMSALVEAPRPRRSIVCACGTAFEAASSTHRFCSVKCRRAEKKACGFPTVANRRRA